MIDCVFFIDFVYGEFDINKNFNLKINFDKKDFGIFF